MASDQNDREIRVGDTVRCTVSNLKNFTLGKHYRVAEIDYDDDYLPFRAVCDTGSLSWAISRSYRYELVTPPIPIPEYGDKVRSLASGEVYEVLDANTDGDVKVNIVTAPAIWLRRGEWEMVPGEHPEGPGSVGCEPDPVNHPNHYTRYVIDPATFIAANKLPFDVGNIVKYVLRFDAKNGREDVLKARRYCDMLLERIDREARVEAGEDAQDVWKAML